MYTNVLNEGTKGMFANFLMTYKESRKLNCENKIRRLQNDIDIIASAL